MKTLLFILLLLSCDIYSQMTNYIPYRCNGKWGYSNRSRIEIIEAQYDTVTLFSGGFAIVGLNNRYGLINEANELIMPIKFDEIVSYNEENDFIKARENSKWSYWNTRGRRIKVKHIKSTVFYDCIQIGYKRGMAEVYLHERNGKFGFVKYICDDLNDDSCKILLESKFLNYQEIGSNYLALEDENGWSIFNYSGEIIHDYNFDNVYPQQIGRRGNQFYLIANNSKYGLINTNGEIVLEPKYDSIKEPGENFYFLSKDWYWSAEELFMVTIGMEYFYVSKDVNEYRCND